MKNFAYVSLVFIVVFISSCVSIKSGCGNEKTVTLSQQDIHPIVEATDSLQTFDIEIDFMGKSIDGMLLVKKNSEDSTRVVVNSYFGMSMMDFEFSPNFNVHYILDAFNKSVIIEMFRKDFQLLLGFNFPEQFSAQQSFCDNNESLLTTSLPEGKHFYRISSDGVITEVKAPWVRVKNVYDIDARTITLKHSGIFSPKIIIKKNSSE